MPLSHSEGQSGFAFRIPLGKRIEVVCSHSTGIADASAAPDATFDAEFTMSNSTRIKHDLPSLSVVSGVDSDCCDGLAPSEAMRASSTLVSPALLVKLPKLPE
jgi:hypothetical protein